MNGCTHDCNQGRNCTCTPVLKPFPKLKLLLKGQFTNPTGFWYRLHTKCRLKPILTAGASDAQARREDGHA